MDTVRSAHRFRGRCVGLAAGLLLAASASAQAAPPFAYVTSLDVTGSRISQYETAAGGRLVPLDPPTVPTAPAAYSSAVTPDGSSVYAPTSDGVLQFDVDPGTGALRPKSPTSVAGPGASFGVAVTPDGRSFYVADTATNTVWQYSIDQGTGRLSPKSPATVAAGGADAIPYDIGIAPDGRSAYVTTFTAGVRQYDIDPATGRLTPKSPASVAGGHTPHSVAVTPDGRSAYVTNINDGTVSQYDIAPTTGVLTPKSPATVPAGTGPGALVVSPDGRSLYVHDSGIGGGGPATNAVSQYDIDATRGTLSPKSPPAVSALGQNTAAEIVVTPDGRSVYLVQTTVILQYDVGPATGGLTPKTPATVPTPGLATGIVLASPRQTPAEPTSKEQCKHDGWRAFPQFKNQGQCVSFVASRKPRPPG